MAWRDQISDNMFRNTDAQKQVGQQDARISSSGGKHEYIPVYIQQDARISSSGGNKKKYP
jgi:hypothetical protein